jgi:hypothetical protein
MTQTVPHAAAHGSRRLQAATQPVQENASATPTSAARSPGHSHCQSVASTPAEDTSIEEDLENSRIDGVEASGLVKQRYGSYIQYTSSEEERLRALELLTRRYYMAKLSNKYVNDVVRKIFPGEPITSDLFNVGRNKALGLMKTWKTRSVRRIEDFVSNLLVSNPALQVHDRFVSLRDALNAQFEHHWVPFFFSFTTKFIDFENASEQGRRWARFAVVFSATHARMTKLHELNPANPAYGKYTRRRLNAVFEQMCDMETWKGRITEDDFPVLSRRQHGNVVNLDEDSDADIDESFFSS